MLSSKDMDKSQRVYFSKVRWTAAPISPKSSPLGLVQGQLRPAQDCRQIAGTRSFDSVRSTPCGNGGGHAQFQPQTLSTYPLNLFHHFCFPQPPEIRYDDNKYDNVRGRQSPSTNATNSWMSANGITFEGQQSEPTQPATMTFPGDNTLYNTVHSLGTPGSVVLGWLEQKDCNYRNVHPLPGPRQVSMPNAVRTNNEAGEAVTLRNVFIYGLHSEVNSTCFHTYGQQFGFVESSRIRAGRGVCYGFVQYVDTAGALNCIHHFRGLGYVADFAHVSTH